MSDVMIRVENLSKKYMIGHQKENGSNYVALRDVIADGAKSLVKRFTGRGQGQRATQEEFWALKDVSFELNGRVASLLEVGTGFYPELTGRENIYFL